MRWSVPTICSWIFESIAWQSVGIPFRSELSHGDHCVRGSVAWTGDSPAATVSQGAQSCLNSRSVTASDL